MKRYIVWNSDRTEGFITDNYSDAVMVHTGSFDGFYSSLGYDFYQSYGDEEMHLDTIDLEAGRAVLTQGVEE